MRLLLLMLLLLLLLLLLMLLLLSRLAHCCGPQSSVLGLSVNFLFVPFRFFCAGCALFHLFRSA